MSATQRDAIRAMLADLKMPGALEAVDAILSEVKEEGYAKIRFLLEVHEGLLRSKL